MAKKKAAHKVKTAVKAKAPEDWGRQPLALQVRASKEWQEWAKRLARHCGVTNLGALVDLAFREAADKRGFGELPPVRGYISKKPAGED